MIRNKETETKHPIKSYENRDKARLNNPPVGLVDSATIKDYILPSFFRKRISDIFDDETVFEAHRIRPVDDSGAGKMITAGMVNKKLNLQDNRLNRLFRVIAHTPLDSRFTRQAGHSGKITRLVRPQSF